MAPLLGVTIPRTIMSPDPLADPGPNWPRPRYERKEATPAPFDRGAAAGSLGGVNVQSCARPNGPTGSGHVKIMYSPNGSVSSAVVDAGPFPGTLVGACIAAKFRGSHIPAFDGAPVMVGKSFTIQ